MYIYRYPIFTKFFKQIAQKYSTNMDSNNSTGIIVEDVLDESNFTAVSSIGIDMKQIVDKIQKFEKMTNDNERTNNGDQSTIITQMIWQMGKEMGKLENKLDEMNKENAELKNGIVKMMKAFEGMRLENEGLKEKVGKLVEENGKMLDENVEKCHEFEEIKKEIGGLKEELNKLKGLLMAKKDEEFAGRNAKLDDQMEENELLKAKTRELEKQIKELAIFTEQIDGIEWTKYDWMEYKFNGKDCAQKVTISEDGLILKQFGSSNSWNCIRAISPIPSFNLRCINKPRIAFFYEVQILNKSLASIVIGICSQQIQLEGKWLGDGNTSSIGIFDKGGIWIDGKWTAFGNTHESFKKGNVVGIGIIYQSNSKMECFSTFHGKLLGKAELPSKFLDLKLFPAINLFNADDSVRVNFDKNKWQFQELKQVFE